MPLVSRTEHVDKLHQITNGKFINFEMLIPHFKGQQLKKRLSLEDGFFQEMEDESSLQFYKWADAYIVFMSITLEFYPKEAQGMLRHTQIIKRTHAAEKDAVEYDTLFRRLKRTNLDVLWGEYLA